MKKKIKLIIVDFYGVMTRGSYKETCQYLARKYGGKFKDIYKIVYHKYFSMAAVGKIPESKFLQAAMDELGYPMSGSQLLKIHLSFQKLNKPVFRYSLSLQEKGYKILLLSKNTPMQFKTVLKQMNIRKYFRHIINTFDLKLAKDSPKTIHLILKKFKVKPKEVIIIDDQDFNLKAAKKIGMQTILYKNFKQMKKSINKLIEI